MAKATVICRCKNCGREFEKSTTKANRYEADAWEAWAKEAITECPDCYKARTAKEEANKASEAGLPELTGTEKQVAWANKIRKQFIEGNDTMIGRFTLGKKQTSDPVALKRLNNAIGYHKKYSEIALKNFTTAAFWIDNRNLDAKEICKKAKAEINK